MPRFTDPAVARLLDAALDAMVCVAGDGRIVLVNAQGRASCQRSMTGKARSQDTLRSQMEPGSSRARCGGMSSGWHRQNHEEKNRISQLAFPARNACTR